MQQQLVTYGSHAHYGTISVLDSSGGSPVGTWRDVITDSYDGGSADEYDGTFAGGCIGADT